MNHLRTLSLFLFILLMAASCKTTSKTNKSAKTDDGYKKEIYDRYLMITEATNEGRVDDLMNLTHPRLFDIVPKNMMKQQMEEVFSIMEMVSENIKIVNYSPVYEHDGEKYVLLDYTSDMTIKTKGDEMPIQFVAAGFKQEFGEDNIEIVDDNTMKIKVMGKSTFAITNKEDGKWYFLENKKDNAFYNQLIPKEIQEKLSK